MQQNDNDKKVTSEERIIGMLILISTLILAFGVTFIVIPHITEQQRPLCENLSVRIQSDVPIYSTEDGTAVEGSFVLGFGSIDTYMVYMFYTGNETNGFQRQMIDSSNVYIFNDAETNPHMIKKTVWKMVPMFPAGSICMPTDIVELHVPKNTLIKDIPAQ